ncbi:hypothetical protein Tsubulata_003221, partial [Turnera subulata]
IYILAMDAIFAVLSEVERTNILRIIMQSFGSSYICLWSNFPHSSNFLFFLDGYYQEESAQPSSSSGTSAARHFDEYRREPLLAVNNHVPGYAFLNSRPYIELRQVELQSMASTDAQRRFYQEARIKFNIEHEMRNWFPEDFSRQSPAKELSLAADHPNIPTSSSSSLRSLSLSMDSPESSSLLFNVPNTSIIAESLAQVEPSPLPQIPIPSTCPLQAMHNLQQAISTTNPLQEAILPLLCQAPSTSSTPGQQATQSSQAATVRTSSSILQQTMHEFALAQRNIALPTREREEEAITRAILAVLTSPPMTGVSSATSSSSSTSTHRFSHVYRVSQGATAFKRYGTSASAPRAPPAVGLRRQSMLSRALAYYRGLNNARRQQMQAARPTSTQMHHMISERKRREKINESFQALRSLLPPESKKDKASVLTRTRDYLTSLKAQVEELVRKNQQLEAQLAKASKEAVPASERLDVRVTHVPESTSEQQFVDLQVTVRGENPILDMVIRILEFLKQVQDVNVISVEARTVVAESNSYNRVTLRLNIENFVEMVK